MTAVIKMSKQVSFKSFESFKRFYRLGSPCNFANSARRKSMLNLLVRFSWLIYCSCWRIAFIIPHTIFKPAFYFKSMSRESRRRVKVITLIAKYLRRFCNFSRNDFRMWHARNTRSMSRVVACEKKSKKWKWSNALALTYM